MRCMHTTSPLGWDPALLARALRELRALDHTFTELAGLAQISRSQVSRWSGGGHRPNYDAVRDLAAELLRQHPTDQYRAIIKRLCIGAGYPGIAADLGIEMDDDQEEMVSPYSGQAWRLVETLQQRSQDAGLSPEEERAMIERAMEQAEMAFDAALMRRERKRVEDQT